MKLAGLAHGGGANPLLHMVKSTVPLHGLPHGARSVLISLLSLALRPHRCVLSGRKRDAGARISRLMILVEGGRYKHAWTIH